MNKNNTHESFTTTKVIPSDKIYDSFYSKLYDKLFFVGQKVEFEIHDLIENFLSKSKDMKILDIGCGTGKHIKVLENKKYDVVGLDNSNDMLQIAKTENPNIRFIKGDAMNTNLFVNNKFNIITCYYFTIYYLKEIDKFLDNVYKWLKMGGIFVVHLVNRDKFDPILEPANPFMAFSLQKYSKKRILKSDIVFNNFDYQAEFKILNNDYAKFMESFHFKKKKEIRKQEHKLYMSNIKDCVNKIKKHGFELVGTTDLIKCSYEYQYLFYFKKIKKNSKKSNNTPKKN